MMSSNPSEARLTVWTAAAGLVIGALLVGTVAVVRLHRRAGGRAELGELAPDPGALRYRYAIGAPADATA